MKRPATLMGLILLLSLLITTPGFAQGTSGAATLSGTVVDAQGGVIPGATIEIKNMGTGVAETLVSNENGVFSAPALTPGLYTVTVSLNGFKTSVVSDVRLVAATAAQLKINLELGALAETVEVKSHSSLVQTQSTSVQSTMLAEQITKLPLVTRNGMGSVMFLPGVEQIGGYRGSTINGLPQNTISLTLDGIGIGNNLQTGDGFYAQVFPRLDAIEEVTVTGATPDAANGAQGSVQVAFVTRSGTNRFNQSIYHYYRSPKFNTNYYFNKVANLAKNQVTVHQFGGRSGGPIVRNRAFYFFNYEQFYLPNESTRNRVMLHPLAQQGLFRYDVAGQIRQVNVLDLARGAGHTATSTVDPLLNTLLNSMRTAANTTGTITDRADLNTQQYSHLAASERNEYAPTSRVDVNIFQNHRVTGTYLWQRIVSKPDFLNSGEPAYPGFPSVTIQSSYRKTGSVALRSTFGSNLVNEFKTGFQSSPVDFYSELGPESLANQNGYAIGLGFNLTNATVGNTPSLRNTPSVNVENSITWLRGKHSFSFGGSYTQINNQLEQWNIGPTVNIGFDQDNDPAAGIFNTTNFQGASTANLTSARALYALLTGRVNAINATSRVNDQGEYEYLGALEQRARQNEFGAYIQDQWRITPALTLNAGVRWEVAMPYKPTTPTWSTATLADLCGVSGIGSGPEDRSCNIFKPGTLAGAGVVPQYTLMDPNVAAYKPKYDNFGPNIGVAWRPNVDSGWLRPILGDPEQATLRAGYSVSFNRERMDRFTTPLYANNPGGTTTANRNVANGNLVYPGQTWPVRLSETSRLGPPATCPDNAITAACVPRAPIYPIRANVSNSVNIFDPNLTLPFVRSWTAGFQRALTRDSAIEVVYLGNRNVNAWRLENWNERNLVENRFIDEFQAARANLTANRAAGRGNSFAYFGPGTGTAPLPTYLAYLTGSSAATDPARYTASLFTSSTWTQHLSYHAPQVGGAAAGLDGTATNRANALNAGLPANFFVMNPAVASADIMRASAGSRYNALQLQYRRRLSRGLLVNASYTYARKLISSLETIHQPQFYIRDDESVPHAFKTNWTYDLPFGRGRRFGTDLNRYANAFLGGWELSGTSRIQYQQYSIDGVKLVGMTKGDLQKAFSIRTGRDDLGVFTVWNMDEDIILNTRRAFSVDPLSATGYSALGVPTGRYIAPASDPSCIALYPGDCGAPTQISLHGPLFVRFDLRGTKKFQLPGRLTVDVSFELMNLFDNINFNPNLNPGTAATIFRSTTAYRDTGVDVNDPGGRLGQVVWRVSW